MAELKEIVVLGAGVIGLTTAIKIQEQRGYRVTIIAEILPTDPKSIRYTSQWAGAHHVSLAGDDMKLRRMDQETFEIMWKLSAPGSPAEKCFLRINQEEYYCDPRPQPEVLEMMPDFRAIPPEMWPKGATCGFGFTTVTIDTPIYLNYLMSRFQANGGSIVRGAVKHVDELIENGVSSFGHGHKPQPDAIVICAGLGARTLGGLEDDSVYPIRGQTVLLRAPWIRFGKTLSSTNVWTYIIPRNSGDVIIGGTVVPNDWEAEPRREITNDILQRALALCPEIAPENVRATRSPTVDDLLPIVIEEGCGLRPGRTGGVRLEVEKKKVPIVYNYGHGGYGYMSSWGSASIAISLLEGALKKNTDA